MVWHNRVTHAIIPPGFARRYFVLNQSGVLSYSLGPGKPARDQIVLSRAAISTAPGRKDIHVDSNTATFHIKCLSMDDFNSWMAVIRSYLLVVGCLVCPDKAPVYRRFVVADAQRSSTIRSPKLANWGLNKSATIIEEIGLVGIDISRQLSRRGSTSRLDHL